MTMAVFAVFEPHTHDDDVMRHAERFAFVRDGFAWGAFIFGPLWLLRHRLWIAFVVYVAIVALLALAESFRLLPRGSETIVLALVGLLLGLEGATLRRRKLLWWHWRDAGIVVGNNMIAAEQRFFDRWVADAPSPSASRMAPAPLRASANVAHPAYDQDNYVIGMFPPPGGTR
jgi:hypothetical protein